MDSQEINLKCKIQKVRDSIRKKYSALKSQRADGVKEFTDTYKPMIQPLWTIITKMDDDGDAEAIRSEKREKKKKRKMTMTMNLFDDDDDNDGGEDCEVGILECPHCLQHPPISPLVCGYSENDKLQYLNILNVTYVLRRSYNLDKQKYGNQSKNTFIPFKPLLLWHQE
ncbi:hypothetical protein FQA39_LY18697 [Lamprigera yunnana]|nr:hypothetical protein FQA39_LY18697 [Lamprigera yunnana]